MVYMYHSFLIHSSADGHLGCFHVLAMINSGSLYLCSSEINLECLCSSHTRGSALHPHPGKPQKELWASCPRSLSGVPELRSVPLCLLEFCPWEAGRGSCLECTVLRPGLLLPWFVQVALAAGVWRRSRSLRPGGPYQDLSTENPQSGPCPHVPSSEGCCLSAGYTGPPCSRHPPVSNPAILFVMSVAMKDAGTVGWDLSTSRVYLWVDFWLLEAQLIVSPSLSPVSPRCLHPRSCPKGVWDPTSCIWMCFALPSLGHTPMFAVNSVKVVSCWDCWYSGCFQLQVLLLLQLTCQPGNPLGFPSPSHGLLGLMVNLAVIVLSGIFGAVVWI